MDLYYKKIFHWVYFDIYMNNLYNEKKLNQLNCKCIFGWSGKSLNVMSKESKVSRKRRDNLCCSNKAVTHRLPLGIVNGAVEDCPAARGHGHVPGGPCQVYYRWRSIQDLIQNVIIRIWWRTSDSRVWSFWKFLIQANLKRNASKTNLQL